MSSATSSAFDAGLPLSATDWVGDGTLRALADHQAVGARWPACRTLPSSTTCWRASRAAPGTLDEMARRVGDGLLVTCLWYIREVEAQSLLLTGLTRDGVYVVRDGEVVGAAGNFRFNESPLGMLARIVDAGSRRSTACPREWADWFTRARVAPLAIDGFNLSTPSEAV